MKKSILTLIVLMGAMNLFAQGNSDMFIYKEYDTTFYYLYDWDRRYYDINDDSIPEFEFYVFFDTPVLTCWFGTRNGWESCSYSQEEYPGTNNVFRDLSLPLNDDQINWAVFFHSVYYINHCDTLSYKSGLRYFDGQNYYYGWMEAFVHWKQDDYWSIKVAKTCYCAIPNYPLHWGQTSLEWGVDENKDEASVTLHPNPTTGLVTVMGKDLKSAEVVNMLGQHVAKAQGEGERLTVDISSLPAGIYFVNITDSEGRKCVRKVVKE